MKRHRASAKRTHPGGRLRSGPRDGQGRRRPDLPGPLRLRLHPRRSRHARPRRLVPRPTPGPPRPPSVGPSSWGQTPSQTGSDTVYAPFAASDCLELRSNGSERFRMGSDTNEDGSRMVSDPRRRDPRRPEARMMRFMQVESAGWGGEGTFTAVLLEALRADRVHRVHARGRRAGQPRGAGLRVHQQRNLRHVQDRLED